MKKILYALSALVFLGLIVAACGTQATQAPAPTPETIIQTVEVPVEKTVVVEKPVEVTATPVPAKVKGTIRVGSWESGDALEPWNNSIKGFEAKYPDVKVQLEAVPQGYGDKLLTQFAAGTAPDIFMVGDGDVAKFVGQGVIEQLDPYINGDSPLDVNNFFPNVFDIGKVDGKVYLLPKDYSPLLIYYNKALFDQAGVSYPQENWTWDDFVSAAQKLTKKDNKGEITQWGIELPDSWGDLLWTRGILPIIYQNGGDILSEDGKTTTGYMNGQATVDALKWYISLFKDLKVAPDKADLEALSGVDLFQTGKVAMLWTGRWPLKDFQKNPQLNFGTIGLPMGKQHGNTICWAGFAMYSKGQNKDTAWAFLKYIAAEEGAQQFARYAFTAVKPIAELQGLDTDPFNAPIVQDLQYLNPLPDFRTQYFGECVDTTFKAGLEKLMLEGGDVQAGMDAAAANADACLASK